MKRYMLAVFIVLCTFQFAIAGPQGTSGRTAQTIIDNARGIFLNEDTADFWTDALLLKTLNYGVTQIASLTKCMEGNTQINLTAGVSEYAISGVSYISVEKVIFSGVTTDYTDDKPLTRSNISSIDSGEDIEEPVRYYLWNDRIGLDPVPRTTGQNIIVYYVKLPSEIGLTGTVPLPAIYDYALTLFIAAKVFKRDAQDGRSQALEAEYVAELTRYSSDLTERLRATEK